MAPPFTLQDARSPADMEHCRRLFEEYQASLGISLDFQGFREELAGLPGAYRAPRGALILATLAGEPAGCIALRPLGEQDAEVKRLYVRPAHRASGLGKRLVAAVIERAAAAGYQGLCLDTLATMAGAMRLYERMGFRETAPYHDATLPGMHFFRRKLREV